MNSTGGRSVEKRALTSLGVGVELEWEAGRGNPTPHGLGCEGPAGLGRQLELTLRGYYRHLWVRTLISGIRPTIGVLNKDRKLFKWTKTAEQILAAAARFCKQINGSGH
jgi:hypothetical protein